MLSSVEADSPSAYVHDGEGTGVVDTAPLFPTRITVPSTWSRSTDQTIEFWFKQEPDSTISYPVIGLGPSSSFHCFVAVMRSDDPTHPGKVYLSLRGSLNGRWASANRYDDGEWHHCVIVILGIGGVFNQYFYIDGEYESHNSASRAITFGSWGNTSIGDNSKVASGYSISGSPIDEIALYNYELPDDRILAHYNEVMGDSSGLSVSISGQINISGFVKTNKRFRLGTAQINVDGFIGVLSQDPLLSTVAADQPRAYVNSGLGAGVVGSAPLWPTNISVPSTWSQSSDQTIEFWFKQEPDSTSSYGVLSVGTSTSNYLFVAVMRSNHASYGGQVFLSFAGSAGANWRTENRYDDGQWHHCVIQMMNMYGFLNQYFYIDGEFESSNFYSGEFNFGNWGDTVIGDVSRFANGYSISGSPIDEIALYDYVIDEDRILAHYNEVMSTPSELEVSIGGTISVSGSLSALILRDPLFVRVNSVVPVLGSLGLDIYGKPVSISLRFPTSDLDIIVQRGIGIRL